MTFDDVAMQRGILDAVAVCLGLVCSLRTSSDQLAARRPHQRLCMPQNFIIITTFVLISAGLYGWYMWFLTIQSWFSGGTGSSYKVAMWWRMAPSMYCAVALCMSHFTPDNVFPQLLPLLLLVLLACLQANVYFFVKHFVAVDNQAHCCRTPIF